MGTLANCPSLDKSHSNVPILTVSVQVNSQRGAQGQKEIGRDECLEEVMPQLGFEVCVGVFQGDGDRVNDSGLGFKGGAVRT